LQLCKLASEITINPQQIQIPWPGDTECEIRGGVNAASIHTNALWELANTCIITSVDVQRADSPQQQRGCI